MLEKTVETYLVDRVRAAGGGAYKFTSPARVSVPDRIVVFPPARIYFVELKRPGGKLTRGQEREHERLRALGCDVRTLDSREAVDAFVREVGTRVRADAMSDENFLALWKQANGARPATGIFEQMVVHYSRALLATSSDEQPAAAPIDEPKLAVWYGSLPESNGKSNWTAILHNGNIGRGITLDRSEYPDRVRYEADRARWLIGELAVEPSILDYDADKHSGYTAPSPADERAAFELLEAAKEVIENGSQHDVGGGDVFLGTCDAAERLERAVAAFTGARAASANETGAEGATISQSDEMRRMVREIALKYCGYDKGGEYNVLRYECDEDFFNFVHEAAIALSRSPAQADARDYAMGHRDGWNECLEAQASQADARAEQFPYQKTFNAIAAATSVEGGNVSISVKAFRDAFGDAA